MRPSLRIIYMFHYKENYLDHVHEMMHVTMAAIWMTRDTMTRDSTHKLTATRITDRKSHTSASAAHVWFADLLGGSFISMEQSIIILY